MKKMTRLALAAAAAALTAGSASAATVVWSEDFNSGVPAGWGVFNLSDFPSGPAWFQGSHSPAPFFPAYSGPANGYVASSVFIGAQTVSGDPEGEVDGYLLSPTLMLQQDMRLRFWTRTVEASAWPDYLWVGLLINGQFTRLLEVNPSLTTGGYPEAWTEFSVYVPNQGTGVTGNLVFNYYVPDASQVGNYIGLDNVSLQVPEPAAWLAVGSALFAAGLATSRRRRA